MKKNVGFGGAIEIYLQKLVSRSPLPWTVWGVGLILIVFGTSLKYSRDSVAGARNERELVEIAAKRGDYQTARSLWDDSMADLEDLVYPEKKIQSKIDELEGKLEIYPESREIYLAIAELYKQLGNTDMASDYLEKARVLSPNE